MDAIRIALIKAVPKKWDITGNWEIVKRLVEEMANKDVDVVCMPECFLDGYVTPEKDWTRERFLEIAQEATTSQYVEESSQIAQRLDAYFLLGCTEMVGDDCYNATLLFNRNGEITGRYYKTHLQSHDLKYSPGKELPVFATDCGKVGIVICADRRWPEAVRTLRVKGAELILNPSYGMWGEANEWWLRTRAYENEAFYCFCHPNVAFIANPRGDIVAKLQSNVPDVLIADISLDEVTERMIADRRPELYGAVAEHSEM